MASKSWDFSSPTAPPHASSANNIHSSSTLPPTSSYDNAAQFSAFRPTGAGTGAGTGANPSSFATGNSQSTPASSSSWFQRIMQRLPPSSSNDQQPSLQSSIRKGLPSTNPQMYVNQPPDGSSKTAVDDIPITRPTARMKFLERGADDHFSERALTRKELFDLVCQLAAPTTRDNRRVFRNAHPPHLALGARQIRSDNTYRTPSQSPPPQPRGKGRRTGKVVADRQSQAQGRSRAAKKGGVGIGASATSFTSFTGYGTSKGGMGNRLTLRDMRQIDPKFSSRPAIWVREEAMLVNLESIRAIILYDRLFLFDPDNEIVKSSVWHIEKTLAQNIESNFNPFEFRALEGILVHTCLTLESDLATIEPVLRRVLSNLPTEVSNEALEYLHFLEGQLKRYFARARKIHQAIQAVLDDDEDMADMYLSEKRKSPGACRNPLDHNDVEMLLETYLQQVDDISSRAELLQQLIDDTEDLVQMRLDSEQNRVLLMSLMSSSVTTAFSFAALVTSVFGMNVVLPWDMGKKHSALKNFLIVCALLVCLMLVIFGIIMKWCQRKGLFSGKLPGQSIKPARKNLFSVRGFNGPGAPLDMSMGYPMPVGSQGEMAVQMSFGASQDASLAAMLDKSGPVGPGSAEASGNGAKRRFGWLSTAPARTRMGGLQHTNTDQHAHSMREVGLGFGMGGRRAKKREHQGRNMRTRNHVLPVTEKDVTTDKSHVL